ncbi:MAG: thioredoxin family protein [Pseudomonadota bacterium]
MHLRAGVRMAFGAALVALAAALAGPLAAQTRLLMFEQPGCAWCAKWDAEVAPEYPETEEGRRAPIERVQLRGPLPEGVELASRPMVTPVFVLVHEGEEVGRITGYPGEDFFWPMLSALIDRLPAPGEAAEPPS